MSVSDCKVIDLPKIADVRGNLTFMEGGRHIPFEIKRVFYLYDIPTGESRGAHAHKELHQLLICLSGGFDVAMDDGTDKKTVRLNRPWQALHVPPMIWAAELNFDPGSVCLVLASMEFREADYYRDYEQFLSAVRAR
ncbi:FdtA/QdtA family cupin domain-containing protein [Caballeronia sp. GAOx1]|uniref:sugar 3,4-ketoisomerase n=1 Tax=Caballeronia sp. GAOx1 TaxID=2921761 RepID=UPI002028DF0F|nr:FdtA/QdtA family cupin domain-containing protein [Caballeronia sp. GAOx1]